MKAEDVQRSLLDGTAQFFDVQITPLIENGTPLGVSIMFDDKTLRHQLQEAVQRHQQELETANEELQSTNEELTTINEELHQRTEELNQTNAFLHSILGGLHAGVVVLDSKENIISWNHKAEDLWGLRAEEVQGRSLLSLDIVPVEKVKVATRACLIGESEYEESTLDAINRRGKSIRCRVTCAPIVGANNERHGSILTMEEMEP